VVSLPEDIHIYLSKNFAGSFGQNIDIVGEEYGLIKRWSALCFKTQLASNIKYKIAFHFYRARPHRLTT
jgi:hypothetical protein